jgi:hypothetical protein
MENVRQKQKMAKGLLLIGDRGMLTNNGTYKSHKDF